MSAGLGDVIDEFLQQSLPFALTETTSVVSNRMQFDESGRLVDFSEPLLHMFNKNGTVIDCRWVDDKTHCLLLGDSVGDLTMADGLNLEVLKIGFLNEKVAEKLEQYRGPFDVVVTHDGAV